MAAGPQLFEDPAALDRGALQRRRAIALRRHRVEILRHRLTVLLAASLLAGAGLLTANLVGGHGKGAKGRLSTTNISFTSLVARDQVVPGRLRAIPWASSGQGAVAVVGMGVMTRTVGERPVPIASMTKMMTALIVLRDFPLKVGERGPVVHMTESDVHSYEVDDETDESNAPVRLGERLTEYQLLEALLIPSADNIADLLASYDAGSIPAFVAKMNVTARALGLRHTHYADASGVNPHSVSTAADQAVVASALMVNPVVREIVRQPSVAFPVAGTLWNANPAVGHDGIIGVKSGFTSKAQGCLATAAYENVGNRRVLVVAVTTGQPEGLYQAATVDESLTAAAASSLKLYRPFAPHTEVAKVQLPGHAATSVVETVDRVDPVVVWPGMHLTNTLLAADAKTITAATKRIGVLQLASEGSVLASIPLEASTLAPTT